jgi:hypothetical protein
MLAGYTQWKGRGTLSKSLRFQNSEITLKNFLTYEPGTPCTTLKMQCSGSGSRMRDPGPVAFLTPRSGMEKNPDPDSGSGMNIPDHFYQSLETVY